MHLLSYNPDLDASLVALLESHMTYLQMSFISHKEMKPSHVFGTVAGELVIFLLD